ncbi:MAG: peptidoglycan DD-metalloendopeptidase family protein [Gammaproteobacteria bacterium]|nr:MAG: peptidoglycan DD-metalloendopeptidase family protein [Gammaproteobacteria bacterium]
MLSGRFTSLRTNRYGSVFLLCCFLLLPASSNGAGDAAEKAAELEALRARIHTLQKELESNQSRKSSAEQKLRDVEKKISKTSYELRRIGRALKTNRGQLAELQGRQNEQALVLQKQRRHIASEARAAYAMGRQQQVKLLLNQEQPSVVGRMLTYFGYFSRARMVQIDSIHHAMDTMRETEASIQSKTRVLSELHGRQQSASQQLREKKQARKQVLVQINRELENQSGELQRLEEDEKQLQKLLASLQELLADIPADISQQPFRSLKGKLLWPARGKLTARFGGRRGNSGLVWQGVMISAPEGTRVRAVSQGRVAFADWMRGFGLLLIIDHGDGYMSLYGHNQALYKEVGEWVDTGEVIATLGASGGQTRSGLYFELRYKGRPINPVRWCAGEPASLS